MSNFTTFFPSAAGGGGINSYAPFNVVDTNNPVGYNATTGLYTNPEDETVWLRTGNKVTDNDPKSYPNATGLNSFTGAPNVISLDTAATTFDIRCNAYDSTNDLFYLYQSSSQLIHEYTSALVPTGNIVTGAHIASTEKMRFIGNDKVYIGAEGKSYNIITGSVVTTGGPVQSNSGIWVDSITGSTFWISLNASQFKEYSSSTFTLTGATQNNFTSSWQNQLSSAPGNLAGSVDTLDVWYGSADNRTTYTGQGVLNYTNGVISDQEKTDAYIYKIVGNEYYFIGSNGVNVKTFKISLDREVGDPTIKTDSSGSAQPLFIKLK
jgi:hypothetical protein